MSLTFLASATLASLGTVNDIFINENTGNAYVVNGNGFLMGYNPNTWAFVASAALTTTPYCGCMINSASAVVVSSNTTVDFVNMSNMFKQTVAGGATPSVPNALQSKQQFVAADTSAGVAVANGSNSSSNTLMKITASPQAVSTFTIPNVGSTDNIQTVIFKSSGRWIVGTFFGNLFEIDSSGVVYGEMSLSPLAGETAGRQASPTTANSIYQMSYDNNLLVVNTTIGLYLVDWGSKTILQSNQAFGTGASSPGLQLCQGASGVTVITDSCLSNESTSIRELDCTIKPLTINSVAIATLGSATPVISFSPTYQISAYMDANNRAKSVSISPRASTTKTVWVQSASSGGVDQQARLIIIDDTNGVNNSYVILDTVMQSPATYRIPTGRTLMELVKVNNGANATWDVSRYST
jgi:hypothetical protein